MGGGGVFECVHVRRWKEPEATETLPQHTHHGWQSISGICTWSIEFERGQ